MEAAIATALSLAAGEGTGVEIADARADVERLVLLRQDLKHIRKIYRELSHDQRLVLASQLFNDMECAEFCRAHGWSKEKYRKVAQRARARITRLLANQADPSVPLAGARRTREQGHTYDHSSPT
jgi:DNA-directed RNA polymerase specialized sigma24 family protein